MADGRRAAYAIMRAAGIEPRAFPYVPAPVDKAKLAKRGRLAASLPSSDKGFLAREAERCLACDSACLRCVEVCPNRANMAIPVDLGFASPFTQAIQILHVDRLCNECGNCGLFCPYEGEPYRGKPTLFDSEVALGASHNAGFAFRPQSADGGDRARPTLVLRSAPDTAVIDLSFPEWESRASQSSLEALAFTVLRDHPYMIGGKR